MQGRIKAEEQWRADTQDRLQLAMRAMQMTKEGLEHLAGKLNHILVAGPAHEESPQDVRGGASTQVWGSAP